MFTSTTSEPSAATKPPFVSSDIPIPPFTDYRQLLRLLDRGDSFAITPAEKKLVQEAARSLRCQVCIATHEGVLRAWVVSTPVVEVTPLDGLVELLREFAVIQEPAKPFVIFTAPVLIEALATVIRFDARFAVWCVTRRLGRGLSHLARRPGSPITVAKIDPKRGNVYRLDLDALRASVSRPEPESAILTPEVAETSLAANVATN